MKTGNDFTDLPNPFENQTPALTIAPAPPRSYARRIERRELVLPSRRALDTFLESQGQIDHDPEAYEPFLLDLILKKRIHEQDTSELRKLLYTGTPNEEGYLSNEEIIHRLRSLIARVQDTWNERINPQRHDLDTYREYSEAMEQQIHTLTEAITAYRANVSDETFEPYVRAIEDLCIEKWHEKRTLVALKKDAHDPTLTRLTRDLTFLQPIRNAFYRRRLFPEMYLPQRRTGT